MIVLGLSGRLDIPGTHDAAACLAIDGKIIGALEQERVSRRRYAHDESAEGAVRTLLDAYGLHPADIQAIAFPWLHVPEAAREHVAGIPCGVHVSDRWTETILPTLAKELGTRKIHFFDHHLCHAAHAYFLNPYETADVLVFDGWGGDGSTSLFHAQQGRFRLLERYDQNWSLGVFYESASYYAKLGWYGAGKLMGLSSFGRKSDRRFIRFDPAQGRFALDRKLRGAIASAPDWKRLGEQWVEAFAASVFPYTPSSGNIFDYAPFAADVQTNLEEIGLALTARLRRLSGEDTLLLAGGVALNAHMNGRIARESGYARVSGTVAPNDGGTVMGAALLAECLLGKTPQPLTRNDPLPIFFGPPVPVRAIEAALDQTAVAAEMMEPQLLRAEVAAALGRGEVVAWFDGAIEFGPRALGGRSLLASPCQRTTLDRLNRIKGRESWRPAALSLTAAGFQALDLEPAQPGLSDYMLCTHRVGESEAHRVAAGVHVDGTTRAQLVADGEDGFGALLAAVAEQSGLPAVINTSLNIKGQPLVLTPQHAIELMVQVPELDMLAMPPYLVRRGRG